MLRLWILLLIPGSIAAPIVLDRVAVIVGRQVVKSSDIDQDLRATEFLNRQTLDLSGPAKRKAAERLVDQELIRQEIRLGGYAQPTDADASAMLAQLRKDRFNGSDQQLRTNLARYGLTEQQLLAYLQWQLTVLRFIDQRFRPAVVITDEEVQKYYEEHKAQLPKAPLETQQENVRETVTGERVNEAFEQWLKETRGRTRVQIREAAFPKE